MEVGEGGTGRRGLIGAWWLLGGDGPAEQAGVERRERSVPLDAWPTTNVTLLGDAIHTMTPGRGVGANTALRDALLLCRKLIEVRDGRSQLIKAVNRYKAAMIAYGFDAILKSRAQTSASDPVHKPVVGRVVLAGMRTVMRTVNHLPPVKRRMRDSMMAYRGADRDETAFEITPPAE